MIDDKIAKKQVARLSLFEGFPREPLAIKELVLAVSAAETEELAERTVTDIIESSPAGTRCPYPADLRRLIYERMERERRPADPIPAKCLLCDDSGVVGGVIDGKGKDAGPCRWCTCSAAYERMEEVYETPEGEKLTWVDRVNRANAKLLGKFPNMKGVEWFTEKRTKKMLPASDVNGELL